MPGKKNASNEVVWQTNKLYQTLRCLDGSETKRLSKYLNSPYFNQSKILIRLFDLLLDYCERKTPGFDRHQIWTDIFPGKNYDDVNFRKHCSDLLKLVQDFMAQETIMYDTTRRSIDALDFVVRRKIEPLFAGAMRQIRDDLGKKQYRSMEYFKNAYTAERMYYAMMDFDVKLNVRANIEEISHHLDIFYWIEKLKLYSSVLSQKRTGSFEYKLNFIDDILIYLKAFPIDQVPELAIYYYSFLTLYEEEENEHYFNLRKLLDRLGHLMPQKEAVELYDSALHYCIGKLNKGSREFLQEYFNLFEDGLRKEIFIVNEELATWRYNNAVGVALQLGKLDWAELFIENYKKHLPADTQQNTYTFNLARVYRYQNKYDKVLSLLRDVEYEDIGYNLISKAILIITYYELDEHDALDPFMESFRVFLNRHKTIPNQRRQGYLNLIKYVRRLTRISSNDKTALEKLRQDILKNRAKTVNHEWLLEKISELE